MGSTIHADSIEREIFSYIATQDIVQWTPTVRVDDSTFNGSGGAYTFQNIFVPGCFENLLCSNAGLLHNLTGTNNSDPDFLSEICGVDFDHLGIISRGEFSINPCPVASCVTGVVNVYKFSFDDLLTSENGLLVGLLGPEPLIGSFPTEPTPEPGTLLLFGSGIGALGWIKRKGLAWHARA
jgi:hypothetical protein